MLKKIKKINMGIFDNYDWDSGHHKSDQKTFLPLNIIYGRNYSGKTTLSRVLRALETGRLSDKYENPTFQLEFKDGTIISENGLSGHNKTIRVFNSDFIRENLKFILDPDDNIEPFAMIGEGNIAIEQQILAIENEIGNNTHEEKTGLYLEEFILQQEVVRRRKECDEIIKRLDNKLQAKATDREVGIKYQDKYGDRNYNITKLNSDLEVVNNVNFTRLPEDEIRKYEAIINDRELPLIMKTSQIEVLSLTTLISETQRITAVQVVQAQQIESLLQSPILNSWVNSGLDIHKDGDKCIFCDNPISSERWRMLQSHFNESYKKLEKEIEEGVKKIQSEKAKLEAILLTRVDEFYSSFQDRAQGFHSEFKRLKSEYLKSLKLLAAKLLDKKSNPFIEVAFGTVQDLTGDIEKLFEDFYALCKESNAYTNEINQAKRNAQNQLRLNEVYLFSKAINYMQEKQDYTAKEDALKIKGDELAPVSQKILDLTTKVHELNSQLSNEGQSITKINELLRMGNLDFQIIQKDLESSQFVVVRNEEKAYHLSEGECTVIAFCYFLVKLNDVATEGKDLIVWIDDPISSLDVNHIFFIYSLIDSKIIKNNDLIQLFISTHNLDFLGYLKKLGKIHGYGSKMNNQRAYFTFMRQNNSSALCTMPSYLKNNMTEFVFLFKQIHTCANENILRDETYECFYSFGNNLRKFLELFFYYKYPDKVSKDASKIYFSNATEASIIARIDNELSHSGGTLERSSLHLEVPEIHAVAKLVVETIKAKDLDQYKSLCNAINS